MPQLNKYSLDSLNFTRGILVFLLGLVFFLGITKQDKAMKIGFTFFRAKMDLLCISKVSLLFCVFLIRLEIQLHACTADWARLADVAPTWHIRGCWLDMLTGHPHKTFWPI